MILTRRVGLKRGAPLRRTARLTSTTPLQRRTGLNPVSQHRKDEKPERDAGRRPKSPRAALRDTADGLFSTVVRSRASGCELRLSPDCRGTAEHCCHLISRKRWATRWLDDNAAVGCCVCHGAGHAYKADWLAFCVRRLGQERWEALVELSKQPQQSTDELREIVAQLRALARAA